MMNGNDSGGHYEIATGLKPFAMTRGGHYEIATLPLVARNDECDCVIASILPYLLLKQSQE